MPSMALLEQTHTCETKRGSLSWYVSEKDEILITALELEGVLPKPVGSCLACQLLWMGGALQTQVLHWAFHQQKSDLGEDAKSQGNLVVQQDFN